MGIFLAADRSVGALLLLVGVLGIVVYLWLMFASPYDLLILKLTAVVAVASIFGIFAWIGYTMVTTPSVAPVMAETQSPESDSQSKGSVKKEK